MSATSGNSDDSPSPGRPAIAPGLLELGFLTEPAEGARATHAMLSGEREGDFIDRYQLKERIGEGGFGFVWRVEQTQPFYRELALKLIKPGMDSREIIARFQGERQALALMDHPNIAAVLDAGTTGQGRPYFVMELVKGSPITTYADAHQLSLRDRIQIFIPVCQAVQHAHQKAILHRDLKPSNLLVAEVEGKPVPKVIDFGIAKALGSEAAQDSDGGESILRTQQGSLIGTPRYMSPEQAGSMPDVDTRSDVYALGVILCELLTGRTPFDLAAATPSEIFSKLQHADPPRPSLLAAGATAPADANATTTASLRGTDSARLQRALRGDLDWIVLKALEKDRSRRYATPLALAEDLQRYLDQQPVSAAAPTWHYQLGKFARRHRGAFISSSLVALALIGGTAVSLWQASRAEKSRIEAEANYRRAREAVKVYLSRVTEHPRLRDADFQDLQLSLLETAIPYYEEMSNTSSDDPALQADRAEAYQSLALIYRLKGDSHKAEDCYKRAIEIREQLHAADPGDSERAEFLAQAYNSLGVAQELRDDLNSALQTHDQAVALFERLLTRDAEDRRILSFLAVTLSNKGAALVKMDRDAEAAASFERAIGIQEKLLAKSPDDLQVLQFLGSSLLRLGEIHATAGKLDLAEAAHRRAVASVERVYNYFPADAEYRRAHSSALHSLGRTLCANGKSEEGLALLRQAMAVQLRLRDDFPSVPLYWETLTMRIYTLAVALDGLGRANESLPVWQNLMNEQDRLVAKYPNNAKQVGNFANTLRVMSLAARDRGDLAAAMRLCQRSVEVRPDEHNRKLLAELAGQTAAPVASTESKPVTRPPQRFRFDYKYTDPGSRYWVKEGLRWVETLPSGSQNVYEIAGPVLVNGVPGTEIRRLGSVKLTLFIPDLGAEKVPWLRMVEPSGKWGGVGPIMDLE